MYREVKNAEELGGCGCHVVMPMVRLFSNDVSILTCCSPLPNFSAVAKVSVCPRTPRSLEDC